MKLIGLAGPAGVGKDTIADYLVDQYDFTKFSFSDPLYDEVAAAFDIDKALLYNRATKEDPRVVLQYWYCADKTFQNLMFHLLTDEGHTYPMDVWVSPRWVLQRWGTDYRRGQDPAYWTKKADRLIQAYLENAKADPATPRGGLVNCSVRFDNERSTIEDQGGEIWHVKRDDWGKTMEPGQAAYVSEQGLTVLPRDKVIHNNGTIEQLHTATSLLLSSAGGTSIECKPAALPFLVACSECGRVYRAYTLAEVRQEIAEYNELREQMNWAMTSEEQYHACSVCDGTKFHRVPHSGGSANIGNMPGVLFEEKA